MEFPQSTEKARKEQLRLRGMIRIVSLNKSPRLIAGVDASFSGRTVLAVASVFRYPEIIHVEDSFATADITMPYIPGFLSFREGPAILKALGGLRNRPDVVLFDGQGIAHPLEMGIAAHMGVLLNVPAIGCAKSRLVGTYNGPGRRKGECADLVYHGNIVGSVVRTRDNVKPLFVSPGHLIDLKGAVEIVLSSTGKYRIPEPLRRADLLTKRLRKEINS